MLDSYFIFLNKPEGISSNRCLQIFKKKFGIKKAGHHGTLDPFASGLLLVGVNRATKFFPSVPDVQKKYSAVIFFGKKTDTGDPTGRVLAEKAVPDFCLDDLKRAARRFIGKRWQIPPMYSAVKVNGQRLYKLARQGKVVKRKPRKIQVFDFTVEAWARPFLYASLTVSRGAYVRALAEEFCESLGGIGHLSRLVRTELCGYGLDRAHNLQEESVPPEKIIPIAEMIKQ